MTTLSELKIGMRNISVQGKIDSVGQERQVQLKSGGSNRVCDVVMSDPSGKVKLVLWGSDIDKVRAGDTVKIENGYTNSYKGELQLATGKFGKISRA